MSVYSVTLRNDGQLSQLREKKNSLHPRRQGKSVRLTADDAGAAVGSVRRAGRDASMAGADRMAIRKTQSRQLLQTPECGKFTSG